MIIEYKFHCYKNNFLEDIRTDSIMISDKVYSGVKNYKHFIGYMDGDYKNKPFLIMLPKTSGYVKY